MYLGFREFTKHGECSKFAAASVWHQKLRGFHIRGALSPNPLTRGSTPGSRWGLHPRSHYRLAFRALSTCVHPTFFDLAMPLPKIV